MTPEPANARAADSSVLDVWADVVAQDQAVSLLQAMSANPVHAFLFLGPHGSGKRALARAFAATLISAVAKDPVRAARLALAGRHPDLIEIAPEGNMLRGGRQPGNEVSQLLREAALSPIEGPRKVLVVDQFHTANEEAIGRMLKAIEEPNQAVVWVLLSEEIPKHQETIKSRCVVVELHPVPLTALAARLVDEGVDQGRAELAASAAAGDIERARLLANDERLVERTHLWESVPRRLDGTGSTVTRLADELLGSVDEVLGPLKHRQDDETTAFEELEEEYGVRVGDRRRLTEKHKRELRQLRTDELIRGLGAMAGAYRSALIALDDGDSRVLPGYVSAMDTLGGAARDLTVRNANERLFLLDLLLSLPALEAI